MLKKIVSIIILSLSIIAILYVISPIFVPKWTTAEDDNMTQIVRGFYAERDNSLDVIFMGNSDMYNGMAPMQLWDDYGIASYAYTSSGQRMWTAHYMFLDALRSQKPKIIVFDVDEIQSTTNTTAACYRKAYDNMQMSPVKIRAIMHPCFKKSISKRISFFLPVTRFHSRISSLTKDDFKYAYGYKIYENKGQVIKTHISEYRGGNSYMDNKNEKYEFPKNTKKYMDKIVKTCKEKNIELILIEIPSANSWSYAKSQAIAKYASEKNLTFIDFNFLLDDIGLDWTHDTIDSGNHLNIWGAQKVTKYMGRYLHENYNLPDRRKDKNYKDWFDASKKYHKNIENAMKNKNNI